MVIYVQEPMVTVDSSLLQSGEIEVVGRLVHASNASLFCKIRDSENECHAIYKPIAGERPLWDFPDGNLASREVATYLASEELDLNCVPLTILRDGPFGLGSVQYWIDDVEDVGQRYSDLSAGLRKIALLDAVVNNTDRKIGHLLYKGDQIFGCDHGVTFHQEYKLRTVIWQFAGLPFSSEEIAKLENFNCDLSNYLTETEIAALDDRVANLLHEGTFPMPPTDWPAIPWPPV